MTWIIGSDLAIGGGGAASLVGGDPPSPPAIGTITLSATSIRRDRSFGRSEVLIPAVFVGAKYRSQVGWRLPFQGIRGNPPAKTPKTNIAEQASICRQKIENKNHLQSPTKPGSYS